VSVKGSTHHVGCMQIFLTQSMYLIYIPIQECETLNQKGEKLDYSALHACDGTTACTRGRVHVVYMTHLSK
jgi:hypothetical protein